MNFAKFLRTTFFTEHLWWLLLEGEVLKKFVVEREVKVNVFIVLLDRHTQLVFTIFLSLNITNLISKKAYLHIPNVSREITSACQDLKRNVCFTEKVCYLVYCFNKSGFFVRLKLDKNLIFH